MTGRFQSWILEACILAALAKQDAYGYELTKINALCASESTICPVLRRLADKGYLAVSSQMHQARLRKMYSITPAGLDLLSAFADEWRDFRRNIDKLLNLGDELPSCK